MWQCRKCGENVPGSLTCCWKCGTAPDGTQDPLFEPEPDDPTVPDPGPGSEETEHEVVPIPRLQFSLRSMMIAVAAVSVVLAIMSVFWRNERRERAVLKQLRPYGAEAFFAGGSVRALRFTPSKETLGDDALPLVRKFRRLRDLDLTYTDVTSAGIAELEGMTHLEVIIADEAKISEEALDRLDERSDQSVTYIFVEVRPGQPRVMKVHTGGSDPIGAWGFEGRQPHFE